MAEFTGRLSNAPVVYVLTQIRFSAVLRMEEYVAEIQEELRGEYPRYEQQRIDTIEIGSQGPSATPGTANRWLFKDKTDVSGFVLDQSSLVFHTSHYTDFPDFKARVMAGASVVQGIANIPIIERVGLRYVDLITTGEDETLDQYVTPGLLGFSLNALDLKTNINQQLVSARTKAGHLIIRFTRGRLSSPLPPDLSMLAPKIQRTPKSNRDSAILDTDHFSEKNVDFTSDRLEKIVTDLQAPIGGIFKAAITDYAVRKWE